MCTAHRSATGCGTCVSETARSIRYLLSLAGPMAVGPEFQVNTFTTGNQNQPKVAADSAGDYVVVWQSDPNFNGALGIGGSEGTEYSIYAQAAITPPVLPRGASSKSIQTPATSADRRWRWTPRATSPLPGKTPARPGAASTSTPSGFIPPSAWPSWRANCWSPATRLAAFRHPHIIPCGLLSPRQWTRRATSSSLGAALTRVAAGTTSSPSAILPPAQRKEATSWSAGGERPISRSRLGGHGCRRRFRHRLERDYDSGGGLLGQQGYNLQRRVQGSAFTVSSFPIGADNSSVAMDSAGDFVVAWMRFESYGVYAQRYNAAGAPQGSQIGVDTNSSHFDVNPSVAMDAEGDFVITWQKTSAIKNSTSAFMNNTTIRPAWPREATSKSPAPANAYPAVAMNSTGNFVVAGQGQDGSGYGIYAQRYAAPFTGHAAPPARPELEFQVNTYTTW